MYSPHSDFYKMVHSPKFILFRVEHGGHEYLVRPHLITVDNLSKPGPKQKGSFHTFSSIQSFQAGYIDNEIQLTTDTVVGLEAIDTIDQRPLNDILAICNDLENLKRRPNIGTIYRDIIPLLVQLMSAMAEFERIHDCKRYEAAYEDLNDIISDCRACPPEISSLDCSNFLRDVSEKVSYHVTLLIERSDWGHLN